jgi:hypothetical protein
MIRHTVAFQLKHPPGSPQEADFLQAARKLAAIPTVRNFECLRQTGRKAVYQFGLSMDFENRSDYESYSAHPDQTSFVQARWLPEVIDFMELDYEPIASSMFADGAGNCSGGL